MDQGPDTAAGDQVPQDAGSWEADKPNTTTGSPRPAARAEEAQDPDPEPQKHKDGEADGTTDAGQRRPGNETHPAPTPDAATA